MLSLLRTMYAHYMLGNVFPLLDGEIRYNVYVYVNVK